MSSTKQMTKRILILICSALLFLSLSGCKDIDSYEDVFTTPTLEPAETSPPPADNTTPDDNTAPDDNTHPDNNMTPDPKPSVITLPVTSPDEIPLSYSVQYLFDAVLPASAFVDIGDRLLFIHVDNVGSSSGGAIWNLYEYDKATGRVELFCKDATCFHTEQSCVAYRIHGNLQLSDGNVYASRSTLDFNGFTPVRMDNNRFIDLPVAGEIGTFQYSDEVMYAFTEGGSFVRFHNDYSSPDIIMEGLYALVHMITDGYLYHTRAGVDDQGYVLYRYNLSDEFTSIEVLAEDVNIFFFSDTNHLYYQYTRSPNQTHRRNLDGSNAEMLPAFNAVRLAFDEDFIYYVQFDWTDADAKGNGEIYRLNKDLSLQPELIHEGFSSAVRIYPIFGADYLFISQRDGDVQGHDRFYFMKKDGTDLTEIILP
ncbi:MAG: DUF5050 domain-containing protein [Oscillospiraceae bacterium]|nr:DUF5050 domain-containing protein [Oscillospiraceae bacterium]